MTKKKSAPTSVQLDAFATPKPQTKKTELVFKQKSIVDDIIPNVQKDNKGFIIKSEDKKPLEQISMALVVDYKPKEERIAPLPVSKKINRAVTSFSVTGLSLKKPFVDGYSREQWLKDLEITNSKFK